MVWCVCVCVCVHSGVEESKTTAIMSGGILLIGANTHDLLCEPNAQRANNHFLTSVKFLLDPHHFTSHA